MALPLEPLYVPTAILGVDFGEKRTGLAIAQILPTGTYQCAPIATINTASRATLIAGIATFAHEWQVQLIVVGEPKKAQGQHRIGLMCQRLARQLHSQLAIPTTLWNEALTSEMARIEGKREGLKAHLRMAVKKHSIGRDEHSAMLLLEDYCQNFKTR